MPSSNHQHQDAQPDISFQVMTYRPRLPPSSVHLCHQSRYQAVFENGIASPRRVPGGPREAPYRGDRRTANESATGAQCVTGRSPSTVSGFGAGFFSDLP
jgi:hypothetical protein